MIKEKVYKCKSCGKEVSVDLKGARSIVSEKRKELQYIINHNSGYEIAKVTGTSEGYISHIKHGNKFPKVETVFDMLEKWNGTRD